MPADLLVVGTGATGLALALQAHDHGARVRVVERRTGPRPSRALVVHPRTLEQLRPLGVVPALAARADRDPEVRLHLGTREVAVPVSAGDRPRHVELDTDLAPGVAHVAAGRRAVVFVFALGERASWRILRERAALLSGSGPGGSGPGGSGPGGSGLSGSGLSGSRPPTDGERTPAAEPPPPAPR